MEPKSCGESSAPDAERERLKLGALGVQSVAVSPGAASLSEEHEIEFYSHTTVTV